ncbi:hypothetical protein BH11ARM1_BH11ARM1_05320 [soil metagenome]
MGTWPALEYEVWKDTYATLHMWTQIVGKICLKLVPPANHFWNITFEVGAQGLQTRAMPYGDRLFPSPSISSSINSTSNAQMAGCVRCH